MNGTYGPYTCKSGYVWRDAFPGDKVCVSPFTQTLTKMDNSLAAARLMKPGA